MSTLSKDLSSAQKAMILAARNLYGQSWILPEFGPFRRVTALALQRCGLAAPFFDGPAMELTDAGLRVRNALLAETP